MRTNPIYSIILVIFFSVLIMGCHSPVQESLNIPPIDNNLNPNSMILSSTSPAGLIKLVVTDLEPLPERINIDNLLFVAEPGGSPTKRIYVASLGDAFRELNLEQITLLDRPQANISVVSQDQVNLIYQNDFPTVTFDDVVLTFALSNIPEGLRDAQTIVSIANSLFESRPQPFTVSDLNPIPTTFNTDYVISDATSPDLLDVAVLYAAFQLPTDLRTAETLALFVNQLIPGRAISADDIAVIPGQNIPNTSEFNIAVRFNGEIETKFQEATLNAAQRWEEVISADLSDFSSGLAAGACIGFLPIPPAPVASIDDLFIDVFIIDQPDSPFSAFAFPCIFRNQERPQPAYGVIVIDRQNNLNRSDADIQDTMTHEIGHVLGIGTLWFEFITDSILVPLVIPPNYNPRYDGLNALNRYLESGGTAATIPVENCQGFSPGCGFGTANSHWREASLNTELMTGGTDRNIRDQLSIITIGALQDIGYPVDFNAADPYTVPSLPQQQRLDSIQRPSDLAFAVNAEESEVLRQYLDQKESVLHVLLKTLLHTHQN